MNLSNKNDELVMNNSSKDDKYKIGAIISIIGALLGIFLVYFSFLSVYDTIMASELAEGRAGGEAISEGTSVSEFVMPAINDIVLLGGALWAVAAFGFIKKENWAWSTAITANVISLLSFFMLIPAMSRGISPVYVFVFVPNLFSFALLLKTVRKIDTNIIIISLIAGMAYVMSFMNGVAATDQLLSGGDNVFLVGQRLSWIAGFAWAGFVIAILNKKSYTIQLGVFAAITALIASVPLGVVNSIEEAKFSKFLYASVLSLILKLIFFLPRGNNLITEWVKE